MLSAEEQQLLRQLSVFRGGFWREAINTNSEYYGGTGLGNDGGRNTEAIACDGFSQSIRVTLPPLSTIVFRWSGGS